MSRVVVALTAGGGPFTGDTSRSTGGVAIPTTAAPLGALVGGLLLQYLAPDVVIGLSGIACVLAGVGGFISPTMRSLDGKTKSVTR